MFGFNNKTKTRNFASKVLDEKQVTDSILEEIHDHFDAISIRHTSNAKLLIDSRISYKELGVNFVNRYLNSTVFDSLVQSGAFLRLRPKLQTRMSDIYGKIKDHNHQIKNFNLYCKASAKKIDFKVDLVQIQKDDPKFFLEMKEITIIQKDIRIQLLILENRLNLTSSEEEMEEDIDGHWVFNDEDDSGGAVGGGDNDEDLTIKKTTTK